MKHKQTLAMLLAAAMVLSMPLGAYADEMKPVQDEQAMMELYGTPDYEAPVLHSISVDKETVKPGETLTFTLNVTDDVSGVNYIGIDLINEATGKTDWIRDSVTVNENNEYTLTYTVPKDEAVGTLRVTRVHLSDKLGYYENYHSNQDQYADKYLPNEISVEIVESASEDKEAPVLHDLSLSDTTVSAPGKLTLTLNVSDDMSGVNHAKATFINRQTGKEIDGSWHTLSEVPVVNGDIEIELTTTQYDGSGSYELDQIYLTDDNGHHQKYYSKYHEYAELLLPTELSFTVTNESGEDVTAPVLKGISIDKTEVEAPSEVTITLDVEDNLSGYRSASISVINRKNDRIIDLCYSSHDNPNKVIIPISEWEPSGLFEVNKVTLFDNNNNMSRYNADDLPNQVSFLVKNIDKDNPTGDIITSTNNANLVEQIENMAEGSTAHIYYGNGATLKKEVFEAIKGQDKTIALKSDGIEWIFNGQDVTDENIKNINLTTSIEAKWDSDSDAAEGIDWQQNALILSFAENGKLPAPATIRIKADWVFKDEVGTENLYVYYYDNTKKEYVQVAANLTITQDEYLEFTIDHNSDFVITQGELKEKEEPSYPDPDVPQPDPDVPPTTPDHKPSRPDGSTGSSAGSSANSSANSSNASGVVNYESEKPDPADKQAVKAYNFWQDAKSKIRKTAEGKTLRLSVPKEITNMPASVMETLRKENVGLRLNWNGKTITIPAGKAQPKQKMRIYWTMQTLEKLYNA
ncbi:MAG: hypothetical protein UEP78_09000 [Negativibacillus sp.]|nr:hypothetical protein [Negativibacillus sp.]